MFTTSQPKVYQDIFYHENIMAAHKWATNMFSWWHRSWYTWFQYFFKFCWIFLLCHWKMNFYHILEFILCPPCNCYCFQIQRTFCLFWFATQFRESLLSWLLKKNQTTIFQCEFENPPYGNLCGKAKVISRCSQQVNQKCIKIYSTTKT